MHNKYYFYKKYLETLAADDTDLVPGTMFTVDQIGQHSGQTGVELVEPLYGPVIVAVTQRLTHKVGMVQNVIGYQRFLKDDAQFKIMWLRAITCK